MKLIDRSNADKISTPIQVEVNSTDQSSIKLIYRGHTYDYTPRPVVVSKAIKTDELSVTLIYRGNIYERQLPFPKTYQKPRGINWRYQS